MESITNPKIELEPWLSQLNAEYMAKQEGESPFPTMEMRGLRRIPTYMRYPEENIDGIRRLYENLKVEGAKLRPILEGFRNGASGPPLTMMYSELQAILGLWLTLSICTNAILSIFYPSELVFIEDWPVLYEQIVQLSKDAMSFRPLGASYIPLCLLCAWGTTDDPSKRAEVDCLMACYQPDFPSLRWSSYRPWLVARLNKLRKRLALRDLGLEEEYDSSTGAVDIGDGLFLGKGEPCCIL